MRTGFRLLLCLLLTATVGHAEDWESPLFLDPEDAVRAAIEALDETTPGEYSARELFTLFVLSAEERPGDPRFDTVRRETEGSFLVSSPSYLEKDAKTKRTLEAFLSEIEDEKEDLAETLARFGFPELRGLTYVKLVDNVTELQAEAAPSSTGAQIQGLTYFCRYVLLPLSYITPQSLEQLQTSSLDPTVNVNTTLDAWERESYRTLLRTFRHEMVHVWANTSLGPPTYRDRELYPDWFSEGSASFLAADPHASLSEDYKRFQNLIFYLVERHGVEALRDFYSRTLEGASAAESLQATYGIADEDELEAKAQRWRWGKATFLNLLAVALLLVVVASFLLRRLPVFGSLQLWIATMLGYATFSGFSQSAQALNGATAVLIQQVILGTGALFFFLRGLRSLYRFTRRRRA